MHEWRHAIQLFFDTDSEAAICGLIDRFRSDGLVNPLFISANYRPHITLSVYRELDQEFAKAATQTMSNLCTCFGFRFSYVGFFNADIKALFLGPTVSPELRAAHGAIHQLFADQPEKCWDLYLPNLWVPHCGVLIDDEPGNLLAGAACLFDQQLPQARVTSVAITGFRDLHEFPLKPD